MFDADWASRGFCIFPLATGVFLFVVSCIQIVRYVRLKEEQSFLTLFVDVVLGIWSLAMSIISSIMITLGFIVWCDSMTERFPTCEITAGQNIIYGDMDHINTSGFYIEMGTAQVNNITDYIFQFNCFYFSFVFSFFVSLVLGVLLLYVLA